LAIRVRPAEGDEAVSAVQEFNENGYTVFRNFFPKEDVAEVLREIERRSLDQETAGSLTKGELKFTINSFKKSAVLQKFLSAQRLIDVLAPIAGGDLWVRWDQAVSKKPGAGIFPWHQDNGYNGLKTQHYQLWVALTETKEQNGALWLAP